MMVDIPKDEINSKWARLRYLKKIPLVERQQLLQTCKLVFHKEPTASALASYLFLGGCRISEATRYRYNGIYKHQVKHKITFKSPAVNTISFTTRPDGVHLMNMIIRREKSGKMPKKIMVLKESDPEEFLKIKYEVMTSPVFQDLTIVCGQNMGEENDDIESLDGPFAKILFDYIEYLKIIHKIKTPLDELRFQNVELFPFASTSGYKMIVKYFGSHAHYFRRMSATLFAREMSATLYDLKARYHWTSDVLPGVYVQEDKYAVIRRQLTFLRDSNNI